MCSRRIRMVCLLESGLAVHEIDASRRPPGIQEGIQPAVTLGAAAVPRAVKEEVAIQIDIVGVKSPTPGESVRIERMDHDATDAVRESAVAGSSIQEGALHRGAQKRLDAVKPARDDE